jgi:hypothetical protein
VEPVDPVAPGTVEVAFVGKARNEVVNFQTPFVFGP